MPEGAPSASDGAETRRARLRGLALLFLRLGTTAFGGPAAHIAMMEHEVVTARGWMTREEFVDLLGATNLIPGPNSTELAIHIGARRAGFAGLLVAGVCFICPAALIVWALAWAYVEYGSVPAVSGAMYGAKPVVIAIVAQAIWRLARTALRTWLVRMVAVLAVGMVVGGVHELVVLAICGALVPIARWGERPRAPTGAVPGLAPLSLGMTVSTATAATAAAAPASVMGVFLFFLKVGSVLFGSGYVLLAFLRADLVERWGWLSEQQLLDAVAVGQITPGPVFTTATFIGYVLAGTKGAVVATLGIFLPAFFFVAISGPLIPRLRRSRIASGVLDGVNAASLALMAVVGVVLAIGSLVDVPTVLLAIASAVLLLRFKVNPCWLALGGAAAGLILTLAGVHAG